MSMFELMALPYSPTDLEPVISRETIELHYGKHLQTYINNLNAALPGSPYENMGLLEIVKKSDGGVFNNAGQILNHNTYFEALRKPQDDNKPIDKLAKAIDDQFGSFIEFKKVFEQKGATLFGSGWVWLSMNAEGKLVISQEQNAGNPVCSGLKPLLTFDVWEHAYYVDYQNRRPAYLSSMWQIIDWDVVERRYNL